MSANPLDSILCPAALASGLISAEAIEYAQRVARHRLTQSGEPSDKISDKLLADILVEQELLTQYQAEQLMQGRTKLTLGPYIVTDWIAQGGMGQVYKAVHKFMGRECAVKVLPLEKASGQVARKSFERETRVQARLDCPYLVRAFDAGVDGQIHYLVTEYVPGMDLRRLVKQQGPLPVHQAAHIIRQAALGLQYAHEKGLIHRDVKPGNILVTPSGDAKVSDLGLAGFNQDLLNDPRAGKIVGTTDYISPEQIRTPLEVKPVADIYSLGCTLYWAVCGKVPFQGGDTPSKLRRHLEETPWHPRRYVPDIPEDFVDIIAEMMEKNADKRIASAKEVAARLEPWADARHSELSTARLTPSPWMAPPPPLDVDNNNPVSIDDLSNQQSSMASSPGLNLSANQGGSNSSVDANKPTFVRARSVSSDSIATASPSPPGHLSPWLVVSLTLAVAIPPTLVIGAILGYLLSRS